MDYVAVILAFISILQNMRKKKDLRDSVQELKNALDIIAPIDNLLQTTKSIHDAFEGFLTAAITPLQKSMIRNDIKLLEIKEHVEVFMKLRRLLPTWGEIKNIQTTSNITKSDLPSNMIEALGELEQRYPLFQSELERATRHLQELDEFVQDENFGTLFNKALNLLEHAMQEGLSHADRLIVASCELVSFVHYQLRTAIKELR